MRTLSTENAARRTHRSRDVTAESLKNYLYFWDTYTLYATVHPAAELHTHTTASITISLDDPFTLEAAGAPAREYRAVFVPPGVEHRVTSPRIRRGVVQLEPARCSTNWDGCLRRADPPRLTFISFRFRSKNYARYSRRPFAGA